MGNAVIGFIRIVSNICRKNNKPCSNVHTIFTKALMVD